MMIFKLNKDKQNIYLSLNKIQLILLHITLYIYILGIYIFLYICDHIYYGHKNK